MSPSFIRTSLVLLAISLPGLAIPAAYHVDPAGRPHVGITPGRRHRPSSTPAKRSRPSPILAARKNYVASIHLRSPKPTKDPLPRRPRPSLGRRQAPADPGATVIVNMIPVQPTAEPAQPTTTPTDSPAAPAPAASTAPAPAASTAPAPAASTAAPTTASSDPPAGPTTVSSNAAASDVVLNSQLPLVTPVPSLYPTDAVMAPFVHHPEVPDGSPTLHKSKVAAIAAILSVLVGLVILITVVKLTSNAIRRHKHPIGKYTEHFGSEDGLIPKGAMRNEKHDFVVTSPDGSETSVSSDDGSPSPLRFDSRRILVSDPPKFELPAPPVPPIPMQYTQLLSPTANLVQQNLVPNRASTASGTLTVSTTSTELSSEARPASEAESSAERTHRRMRSAPVSVAWSVRQSSTLSTAGGGEEGYWDSLDVCGRPESTVTMPGRSSRTRSMDVTASKW
ncbi:hypothetical protein FA95DRAFT_1560206 [Auriscalpium vulgare]|uniref:Uncharacterized protein n=1 Tax=Auriscalpium vulgare TaxID=40419 RepID=A0ACB8RQG9_9AGAM|nr:hypothetical protein FA95DRAFT_1560206 [Auriscalpium vulgare]